MSTKAAAVSITMVFLSLSLLACQPRIPRDALALSPESLRDRQLQTRIFETDDEKMLLTASAAVLQDSGYTIEESEVLCGLIVSTRDRDVTEAGGLFCFFCLGAPYEQKQKIFASLVTRPLNDKRIAVRITFNHMVWNNQGILVKNERINDPEIYQEFFAKLSKSVFLTAHEI